jgi:FKBP-type peptidyl-prolyl cis-trans isomerase
MITNPARLRFLHASICVFTALLLCCQSGICQNRATPSGTVYTINKAGNGIQGTLGDAAIFDVALYRDDSLLFSSAKEGRPMVSKIEDAKAAEDPFSKLIQEAIGLLKMGDSATFLFPMDTVTVKPQGFENAKMAKFVISVHKIKLKADIEKRNTELKVLMDSIQASRPVFMARAKAVEDSTATIAKNYGAGQLPKNIITLPSGLKIAILREGMGNLPKKGELILVNYCGTLKNGTKFDDSYSRGEPFSFPIGVGQVIPGWDEGLMQLKEGTTAVLFVPSQLAYGEQAQSSEIPANSDLVFYVELLMSINLD